MVQSGTYTSHPAAFFDQPFAAPHQSAGSEVPSDSFPPGGSQGVLTFSVYALVGVDEQSTRRRLCRRNPRGGSHPPAAQSAPSGCLCAGSTTSRPLQWRVRNSLACSASPGKLGHQRIGTNPAVSFPCGVAVKIQISCYIFSCICDTISQICIPANKYHRRRRLK